MAETSAPPPPKSQPQQAKRKWKFVAEGKPQTVRFADDHQVYRADELPDDLVDRLLKEAPHTSTWFASA